MHSRCTTGKVTGDCRWGGVNRRRVEHHEVGDPAFAHLPTVSKSEMTCRHICERLYSALEA